MSTLVMLDKARLDAEVMFDMWRSIHTSEQLRAMPDAEFEVWKAETKRLWEILIDAERAFSRAVDLVE